MKCISCGAEFGFADKKCPFCGRPLAETAGHRAEMAFYKADSVKTKKKAGELISGNIPMVISVFVLIVLLAADIAAIYVKENAYGFREDAARRESVKQSEDYSKLIRDYLDAGDYTGFAAFKEYHNIAEWEEPYDDLRLLWEMTEKYTDLADDIEEASMFGPEAVRYDPEQDISNCQRSIWDFYHEYENRLSDIDSDPYRDYIYDMKDKADTILLIYLKMDESGRKEYFDSSDIRQKAYLEEVLLHEE